MPRGPLKLIYYCQYCNVISGISPVTKKGFRQRHSYGIHNIGHSPIYPYGNKNKRKPL